jgi:hypothetical protein
MNYFDKFYVVTDRNVRLNKDCVVIKLHKDLGWSCNIIEALEYVEEDVFFMGCEDHICVDFNKELIDAAFYEAKYIPSVGCVRLTHKDKIKLIHDDPVSAIKKSYPYYVSLNPTIWKKSYLESILVPGENSWEFEIHGSKRAMEIKDLKACCVRKTIFNYKNLMEKGVIGNRDDYRSIHG